MSYYPTYAYILLLQNCFQGRHPFLKFYSPAPPYTEDHMKTLLKMIDIFL